MKSTLLLIAVLALSACGGQDICDRTAKLSDDCGEQYTDADFDTCKASLEGCDNADHKVLNTYWDCVSDEGLAVCEDEQTGSDQEFDASLLLCLEGLNDISTECADTLYGQYTTYSSSTTSSTTTTTSR